MDSYDFIVKLDCDLRIPPDWNEPEFHGYCTLAEGQITLHFSLPPLPVRP